MLEMAALYLALCVPAGVAGRRRRLGFLGFLFCSVIFTPVLTLLFIYFASPRRAAVKRRA